MSPPQVRSAAPHRRPWIARSGPFAAIASFVFLLLYRMTLFGEALYWGDVFLYFQPLQEVVSSALRAGDLPLWNPYVLCGQPLVGNPQSWVFYPTTVLLDFVPVPVYFTLNALLHLGFGGVGAYLFLRRLCGDRLGAVLGAITFAGSGFLIARLQFPTMIQAAVYLPWILLMADRLIDRPRIWQAALLAALVSLEIMAAHTQLAYMTFVFGTLYAAAKMFRMRAHGERLRIAAAYIVGSFVVGVMGAMVQLLPTIQLFVLSTRERLTWAQANRFVLRPEEMINFLFPYAYGNPAQGSFWGPGNLWEPCVYLGVIPLVLAAYSVFKGKRRPAIRFFGVAAVAALWLAMGRFGGLYWFAYYVVPGLASFHDPARFTFLATFALCVLAATGMRLLRERGMAPRMRLSLVVLAGVNLWVFSAHVNPTLAPSAFTHRPRVMADTPKEGEGRVFTAFRDKVWQRYLNYSDYGPDSARYAHELTNTLAPNLGMRFGVEEGSGYEPVPVKAVTEVDGLVREALERHSSHLPALLGLFDTHLLLLPQSTRYRHPAFREERALGLTVLVVEDPYPRAWLVRKTLRVDGARRTLAVLSDPGFDPRTTAIVSGTDGLGNSNGERASTVPVSGVNIRSAGRSSMEMDVDAGPAPAFLVWSGTAYPGWQSRVDGTTARIQRTNHAFSGVSVGPGKHRVQFLYRPAAFQAGLYISLTALFMMAAALAFGLIMRPVERSWRVTARGKEPVSV